MPSLFLRLLLLTLPWLAQAQPFIPSHEVEVCTIPLPVTSQIVINRMILNAKHVYLKVNGLTFGTPFTAKKTYFGGEAYLYSEDPFFQKFQGKGEECFPTSYHSSDNENDYRERLHCVASKMAIGGDEDLSLRTWYPIFDYHALKNNCGSMARFVVECARGEFSKSINYSIGDRVEDSKAASIVYQPPGASLKLSSSYGEICQLALDDCQVPVLP